MSRVLAHVFLLMQPFILQLSSSIILKPDCQFLISTQACLVCLMPVCLGKLNDINNSLGGCLIPSFQGSVRLIRNMMKNCQLFSVYQGILTLLVPCHEEFREFFIRMMCRFFLTKIPEHYVTEQI